MEGISKYDRGEKEEQEKVSSYFFVLNGFRLLESLIDPILGIKALAGKGLQVLENWVKVQDLILNWVLAWKICSLTMVSIGLPALNSLFHYFFKSFRLRFGFVDVTFTNNESWCFEPRNLVTFFIHDHKRPFGGHHLSWMELYWTISKKLTKKSN